MFTSAPFSLALHQDWKLKLSEWAADGSLGAAAEAAFRLEGRPAELAALISQWAAGDFSALPPIVLLPASSMPGAAGAYAISTGNIYLNQDWLAGASAAQVIAVLTEELGHHLDGFLNVVDTPGDEGEWFAALLTGGVISEGQRQALLAENDHGMARAGDQVLAVEQAARVVSVPVAERYLGASGTRGEYVNAYAFAALRGNGSVVTWGDPEFGGDSSAVADRLSSWVVQVFSNQRAFAALKRDGSVVTWGNVWGGGVAGVFAVNVNNFNYFSGRYYYEHEQQSSVSNDLTSGVTQVYSFSYGFAALKSDSSVVTWGWLGEYDPGPNRSPIRIQDYSSLSSGVTSIISNNGGFAALKNNGSVFTWPFPSWQADKLDGGVTQIYANDGAFAALKNDGSVVVWGASHSGGSLLFAELPLSYLLSSGVTQIIPSQASFAAIKSDGSVVAWGNQGTGEFVRRYWTEGLWGGYQFNYDYDLAAQVSGIPGTTSEVSRIVSWWGGFAALKRDGTVIGWGRGDSHSVESGVVVRVEGEAGSFFAGQIQSGATQFLSIDNNDGTSDYVALKSDGSVVTLGSGSGADIRAVAAQLSSGVTRLFSTNVAFAALKNDGSVVTWGRPEYGGDSSAVAAKLTSGVTQIISNAFSFSALKSDGSVVTWGDSARGGNSSAVASQLVDVVSFANPFTDDRLILDAELPAITLALSPASVLEDGSATLTYTFTRSGPTTNPLTVNYTVGGTASLGTDYTGIDPAGSSKTLSFAAGSATAVVSVDPTADTEIEPDETVALSLAYGSAYTLGTMEGVPVVGTISNDDFPVITLAVAPATGVREDGTTNLVYTFSRTGRTTSALNVKYGISGTAIASDYTGATPGTGKTITFAAGSATATLTIDPTADSTIEANETVALTLAAGTGYTIGTTAAVTGTITNDDFPVITIAVAPATVTEDGTTNLVYTFSRTGPTTSDLIVNYGITGTADTSDYIGATPGAGKTITFAAGSATANLTISPTADTTIEANETVALALAAGTGYSIGTTAAVTGTITNDDFSVITLAVAPATVTEDGTTNLVYTFSRTGPTSSALSVKYTVGGTATLGTDYTGIASTPATKTVSFAAGSATATVTVDPKADTTIEANETVALTLAAGVGYTVGITAAVTGVIINDDISSSTTYTLLPGQSSLLLVGAISINGTGNEINNAITGNNKNNKLHGLLGADTLTGGGTADSDVFAYNSLGESLLGTGSSFDILTDFNNKDFILAPLTLAKIRLSSAIGSVNSLTSASIEGLLTASSFAANSVAAFTVTEQVGTYIAMNDGRGGFQADSDAIVFLPNYAISNVNFVEFI